MSILHKVEDSGKIKDFKKVYRITKTHPMKDILGETVQIPEIHEYTQEEIIEQKTGRIMQKQNAENDIVKLDDILKEIEKIK